jgi:hypothetical protein
VSSSAPGSPVTGSLVLFTRFCGVDAVPAVDPAGEFEDRRTMTASAHSGYAQVGSGHAYLWTRPIAVDPKGERMPPNDEESAVRTRSAHRRVPELRPEERRYLSGRIRRQANWRALTYPVMMLILGLIESLPVFAVIGFVVVLYAFGYVIRLRWSDSLPLISGADRGQRRLIREALRTGHSTDHVTNALIAVARKRARADIIPVMVLFGAVEAGTLVWVCWPALAPTALRIVGAACAVVIAWGACVAVIRLRRLRDYRVTAVSG